MGHVVITYESQDFEAAREIARELEIAGYGTWYRWRDGCVGPSFVGQCRRRISEAGALVALVSQPLTSAVTSSWVASDLETAHKGGKKIVFVVRGIDPDTIIRFRPELNEAHRAASIVQLTSDGVRAMLPQLIDLLTRMGVPPYPRQELPAELEEKVDRHRLPAVLDVYEAIFEHDVGRMMSLESALGYKAVPLENIGDVVVIAVSDPSVIDEIQVKHFPFSHGIEPVLATEEAIVDAIQRLHRPAD